MVTAGNSLKLRSAMGWLAWGAAAFAIVNLSQLPGDFELPLCGPWG